MNFTFKPLKEEDLVVLYAWSKQPILLKFWSFPVTRTAFNEKYLTKITDPAQQAFMVFQDEAPFGYIQSYALLQSDPLYAALELSGTIWGIDQFIGNSAYWGKGLGPVFIRKFVDKLFEEHPTLEKLLVDPLSSNERAIKCYEKVGFSLYKTLERPEGPTAFMLLNRP